MIDPLCHHLQTEDILSPCLSAKLSYGNTVYLQGLVFKPLTIHLYPLSFQKPRKTIQADSE